MFPCLSQTLIVIVVVVVCVRTFIIFRCPCCWRVKGLQAESLKKFIQSLVMKNSIQLSLQYIYDFKSSDIKCNWVCTSSIYASHALEEQNIMLGRLGDTRFTEVPEVENVSLLPPLSNLLPNLKHLLQRGLWSVASGAHL